MHRLILPLATTRQTCCGTEADKWTYPDGIWRAPHPDSLRRPGSRRSATRGGGSQPEPLTMIHGATAPTQEAPRTKGASPPKEGAPWRMTIRSSAEDHPAESCAGSRSSVSARRCFGLHPRNHHQRRLPRSRGPRIRPPAPGSVFQVSGFHDIVHLLFGVAGLLVARTRTQAKSFLLYGGVIYLVLWV